MIYPLKNWTKLKRGYHFRDRTFYNTEHLGLDIIAPPGTPIFAWQDLQIIKFRIGVEGGNTIWVKCPNNPRLFRLMHLQLKVKEGSYREGAEIGRVGSTGSLSRGAHLHIDISKNGKLEINNINNFEDPEIIFKKMVEGK